mgnify:CR=1 FL=1
MRARDEEVDPKWVRSGNKVCQSISVTFAKPKTPPGDTGNFVETDFDIFHVNEKKMSRISRKRDRASFELWQA